MKDHMDAYNPYSLAGKTILVTGASSGIGKGVALECAKLGASVICAGRNRERLEQTLSEMRGSGHTAHAMDISTAEGRNGLVGALPKLNGVAHVAGISFSMLCAYATESQIRDMVETDMMMPILLQTELLQKKKIAKGASIIFMNSVSSCRIKTPGIAFYGAAKNGLLSYANGLAKELGYKGIRVNSILPGMVETPLLQNGLKLSDEMCEQDRKNYPLGRYGKPEDIAHLAAFLLSDAASWISGGEYVIDGGYSIH